MEKIFNSSHTYIMIIAELLALGKISIQRIIHLSEDSNFSIDSLHHHTYIIHIV